MAWQYNNSLKGPVMSLDPAMFSMLVLGVPGTGPQLSDCWVWIQKVTHAPSHCSLTGGVLLLVAGVCTVPVPCREVFNLRASVSPSTKWCH